MKFIRIIRKCDPKHLTWDNLPKKTLLRVGRIIRMGRGEFFVDHNNHTTFARDEDTFLLHWEGANNMGLDQRKGLFDFGGVSTGLKHTNNLEDGSF